MQFVFTYIRKPVRLTWVWRIFVLTGRRVSTQPRDGEWFRAGQSKLPDRTSHSADPRQAAWGTYRFASSRSQLRNKNPVLGKMGKPVSLTDLSLYAAAQGHASLVSPRKWRQRRRSASHPRKWRQRRRSASHPTAPSWTNTRLREYLQTTFPACFVPRESTEAVIFAP